MKQFEHIAPEQVEDGLAVFRQAGARLLVKLAWFNVPALAVAGWLIGSGDTAVAVGLAAALCVVPSLLVLRRGRSDAPTRSALGLTAAAFPALFVFLFHGHAWQMDLHMYFFPSLAALVVLCDRRAILLCAAVISVHHLMLSYLAPQWVFPGSGNLSRVMLHAVLVALQTAILLWIVERLRNTIGEQQQKVAAVEALRVEQNLQVEMQARVEREERSRDVERRKVLARSIETRIGSIVNDLGAMAHQLSSSKQVLNAAFAEAARKSAALNRVHVQACNDIDDLGGSTQDLVLSIATVGSHAANARGEAVAAADAAATLTPRLDELSASVAQAQQISRLIASIAAQSQMLSLNATIEAAREGSRGFGVVAMEMKLLAEQTSQATEEISTMLNAVLQAAQKVAGGIQFASTNAETTREAASAISSAVDEQVRQTAQMAEAAKRMVGQITGAAADVSAVEETIKQVNEVFEQTNAMSDTVLQQSEDLLHTMEAILSELRTA